MTSEQLRVRELEEHKLVLELSLRIMVKNLGALVASCTSKDGHVIPPEKEVLQAAKTCLPRIEMLPRVPSKEYEHD